MTTHIISQSEIKRLFDYHPDGHLIWKIKPSKIVNINDIAGTRHYRGYIRITIKRKQYFAHRLIWCLHHNQLPKEIDHINQIKHDNRIENLRCCTHSQNKFNTPKYKTNTSGYKGVSFCNTHKKWKAQIVINYKTTSLGYHNTPEQAHKAYCKFATTEHKTFFHPD